MELLEHMPVEIFDTAQHIASRGPFLIAKEVLPAMRERCHGSFLMSDNASSLHARKRYTGQSLATQAVTEGLVSSLSASTVRRWLAENAIKLWQHESWIFPRDPDFAAEAALVLDLYARMWNGRKLGRNDYVISADEKSQLQALSRCHPSLAGVSRRATRVEFEYQRYGSLAYFGAYNVHHARLIGHVAPTTGISPFSELVPTVTTTKPY